MENIYLGKEETLVYMHFVKESIVRSQILPFYIQSINTSEFTSLPPICKAKWRGKVRST